LVGNNQCAVREVKAHRAARGFCAGIVGILQELKGVASRVLLSNQLLRDTSLVQSSEDVVSAPGVHFRSQRLDFVGTQIVDEVVTGEYFLGVIHRITVLPNPINWSG